MPKSTNRTNRRQGTTRKPPVAPGLTDEHFMQMAVEQARLSRSEAGSVRPMVGAVVALDGRLLGTGYRSESHLGDHAEFTVLEKKLKNTSLAGATIFTTLEPCTDRSHKKVPCVDRILERKIGRVLIGMLDPNPKIKGKGYERLRAANVDVQMFPSPIASQVEDLNREFIRQFDPKRSSTSSGASIPELAELERIERIEQRHERQFGSQLINLSHWNPSADFKNRTEHILKIPRLGEVIDYAYSYYLDERHGVLERLGYDSRDAECLFTPSGTISVVCAVNWLKLKGVTKVIILAPFYFTMVHICHQFGLTATSTFLHRRDGDYFIPPEVLDPQASPAIWITNPAYSTSVHMDHKEIVRLRRYLTAGGTIVLDESLAVSADALGPKLGTHPNLLCVHSPHKSVSINSFKFSALVFSHAESDSFEQWSDVFSGGLPVSSVAAIRHFLSPNFADYEGEFLRQTERVLKKLTKLAKEHQGADLDKRVRGNFVTIYYPDIPFARGREDRFMNRITRASGATFIPSSRNHTDPRWGFGFRVNLAREDDAFYRVCARLFRALETHIHESSTKS